MTRGPNCRTCGLQARSPKRNDEAVPAAIQHDAPSGLILAGRSSSLAAVSSWYQYLAAEDTRAALPAEHVRRPKIPDKGETSGLTRGEVRS